MKIFRKRGTRSSVALFSVAALALAMTGILYAHWTDTLEAHGVVETGSIDPQWTLEGTSDDGVLNYDGDSEPRLSPDLDLWDDDPPEPQTSSGDQTLINGDLLNLSKDVARCTAELAEDEAGDENDALFMTIENGYPSYYCLVKADLHNFGSVPVKLQGIEWVAMKTFDGVATDVEIFEGPTPDGFQYFIDAAPDMDTDVDLEFSWTITDDLGDDVLLDCGYQLDPGEEFSVFVDAEFHIDQDAMQDALYEIWIAYEWVNWNEYDESLCEPAILDLS